MGAYPYDRSNDPKAAITYGRDFNFFQKITVTTGSFNVDADIVITFPTQGIIILNEDGYGSIVQVSFNGNTVHDEMNPVISRGFAYDNRVISKIWFRLETGSSAVVSVRAWGLR